MQIEHLQDGKLASSGGRVFMPTFICESSACSKVLAQDSRVHETLTFR